MPSTLAAEERPEPAPPAGSPGDLSHLGDQRHTGRLVLRLAWPAILENSLHTLLGIVDTILVARLGNDAIAGVGAGTQWIFLFFSVMFGLSTGAVVLVARAIGAGDRAAADRAARQSFLIAIVAGAGFTVLCSVFADVLLQMLGGEPSVIAIGASFLRITSYAGVFFSLTIVMSSVLRGAGDTRTPMIATAVANVVNAGAAYVLIFGHLGLPALGTDGSAWGMVAARVVALGIMLWALSRGPLGGSVKGFLRSRPDRAILSTILRIGGPTAAEQILLMSSFMVYAMLALALGTDAFATQRITFNALTISFLPAFGFSIAATTLTGQALGAGRPDLAQRTSWMAVRMAAVWMSAMGVVFFALGDPLLRVFTDDPAVLELGVPALQVIALASPVWALPMVLSGALRGAGDTRFPLLVTFVTGWLIRVPLGYLFGITLGLGLAGVYLGVLGDAAVGAAMVLWRYRRGAWRRVQV